MPKMKLTMRSDNELTILKPACPASTALFDLLKRGTLSPLELSNIHKMGFEIEFVGDMKTAYTELGKENLKDNVLKNEYFDKKGK